MDGGQWHYLKEKISDYVVIPAKAGIQSLNSIGRLADSECQLNVQEVLIPRRPWMAGSGAAGMTEFLLVGALWEHLKVVPFPSVLIFSSPAGRGERVRAWFRVTFCSSMIHTVALKADLHKI